MKSIIYALVIISTVIIPSVAYCADINVGELVDQYEHATDLQRQDLENNFLGKQLSASGVIENVGEYNFFNITDDTGKKYIKVLTQQQVTPNKTPYQVIFLYKYSDRDKITDLSKGETIEKEGTIIKIIDERLQIAVWIYMGEPTYEEKALFE